MTLTVVVKQWPTATVRKRCHDDKLGSLGLREEKKAPKNKETDYGIVSV